MTGGTPVTSLPDALRHCAVDFAEWPMREEVNRKCPHSNFLKGLKWSPDGCCLLTASDDGWYRLCDLPEDALDGPCLSPDSWPVSLRVPAGELIYDYGWYPGFTAADPSTCCFLSTTRAHPIHLFDACSGALRCTYRAYDAMDEITAAHCVSFNSDGTKVYAGYNKAIRAFDTTRPGRECSTTATQSKRLDGGGLPGIVSCLAFDPTASGLFAAGTYSKAVGVFAAGVNELQLVLHGHTGGVTQVQWSRDGNYLYSGARKDHEIICWDVRYSPGPVYRMSRETASTNQRVQFDIEPFGRYLGSGGEDGNVRVFDLQTGALETTWSASDDTVNGFQFHPVLSLAATASGQRRYFLEPSSDVSDSDEDINYCRQAARRSITNKALGTNSNCLRLWRFLNAKDVPADYSQHAPDHRSTGISSPADYDVKARRL